MKLESISSRFALAAVGLLMFVLAACAPSLSPLYRDYEVPSSVSTAAAHDSVRAALQAAGWTLTDPPTPNVIATEARTVRNWGLYRVNVSLEVLPMGNRYARVFFHPYRKYITGNRSKIPYLSSSLQQELLPPLTESLEARGLELLGTPRERDRLARHR